MIRQLLRLSKYSIIGSKDDRVAGELEGARPASNWIIATETP